MNARQAAKYYKKKSKELENKLSAKYVQQNITISYPKIISIKREIDVRKNRYDDYDAMAKYSKQKLINDTLSDIAQYIKIEKRFDYIPDPESDTYVSHIKIVVD